MGGAALRHAARPAAALAIALVSAGSSVWLASACSSPAPAPPEDAWTSAIGRDHPLAGRIYAVAAGAELDERGLLDALSGATFVLLSPEHAMVDAFAAASPDPAGFRERVAKFRALDREARLTGAID